MRELGRLTIVIELLLCCDKMGSLINLGFILSSTVGDVGFNITESQVAEVRVIIGQISRVGEGYDAVVEGVVSWGDRCCVGLLCSRHDDWL
jgi:hypothetical protein